MLDYVIKTVSYEFRELSNSFYKFETLNGDNEAISHEICRNEC